MEKTCTVGIGATPGKVSRAQLGDAKLVATLADCNGLPGNNLLFVGQRILLNKAPRTPDHGRANRSDT